MKKLALENSNGIFSELESDILEILWAKGSAGSRYLHDLVKSKHSVTHSTIAVTLARLHDKDLLRRKAVKGLGGTRFVYYPKYTKIQLGDQLAGKFVTFLRNSFGDACVANLKKRIR